MRQREREQAEQNRDAAREVKLVGGLLGIEQANGDAARNPADSREHFHAREVLFRIAQMMQRQRVTQRERRRETQAVQDEQRVETAECFRLRDEADDRAAEDAEHAENLFRSEVAIRN